MDKERILSPVDYRIIFALILSIIFLPISNKIRTGANYQANIVKDKLITYYQPKEIPQEIIAPAETIYNDCSKYINIISRYDWSVNQALQVCEIESRGNIYASNLGDNHTSWAGCYGSFGLFQINCSYGKLFDPEQNIRVAHEMYVRNGRTFCTSTGWLTTCKKLGWL